MKRFSLIIMMIATLSGVLAPVGVSLTLSGTASYSQSTAYAQDKPDQPIVDSKSAANITENINCGFGIFGNSSVAGCIATIVYYLVYSLGALVLKQSAELLDVTASYTLSSKLYSASSFINDGWRITRDFANIAFIFILLAIAISLIVGENFIGNPKRALVWLILIALFINFSMFITKVIIDTTNTVGLLFYNQISVVDKNGELSISESTKEIQAGTDIKQRPIAAALAKAFQPQVFQDKRFFDGLKSEEARRLNKEVDPSTMIFVLIMVGVMFWVAAYSFFIAALSFMGRIVMLMVTIVFAPIAFISYLIPSMKSHPVLGWTAWWKNLIGVATSAPIYFFFILLISIMSQSTFITDAAKAEGNSMTLLTTLFISFMILIVMLNRATAFAKQASGEIGAKIANFGSGIVSGIGKATGGLALGAAVGGGALLAQKTVGRVANRIAQSDTLQAGASRLGGGLGNDLKRFASKQALKGARATSSASFNLGATGVGQKMAAGLGLTMAGVGAFSQKNLAGGYEAAEKRKWEKKEAFSKTLQGDVKKQAQLDADLRKINKDIGEESTRLKEASNAEKDATNKLTAAKTAEATALASLTKAQQDAATAALAYQQALDKDKAIANTPTGSLDANGKPILKGSQPPSQETLAAKASLDSANTNLSNAKKPADDATTEREKAELAKKASTQAVEASRQKLKDLRENKENTEKESETNKNARARAYMYNEMSKTGYAVVGTQYDKNGVMVDPGQIDIRQNARSWQQAATRNVGGIATRAASGALVGSAIAPGVGTVVGALAGAVAGVLNNLRANFNVAAGEIVRDGRSGIATNTAGIRRTGSKVVNGLRTAASSTQSIIRTASNQSNP